MSDKITIKLTKGQAHAVTDALMDYIYEHEDILHRNSNFAVSPDAYFQAERVKALVDAYTEILNQTAKGTK